MIKIFNEENKDNLQFRLSSKYRQTIISPVNIIDCIFCHSSYLKKFGIRNNKSGSIQRFLCGSCNRTFSINLGFEKMNHNPQAVTSAIQLYFSGESLRNGTINTFMID
jgi:transposase-like protein